MSLSSGCSVERVAIVGNSVQLPSRSEQLHVCLKRKGMIGTIQVQPSLQDFGHIHHTPHNFRIDIAISSREMEKFFPP